MFACKSEIKGYFICTKKLLPVTDFLLRDDCFKRIFRGTLSRHVHLHDK